MVGIVEVLGEGMVVMVLNAVKVGEGVGSLDGVGSGVYSVGVVVGVVVTVVVVAGLLVLREVVVVAADPMRLGEALT